MKCSLLVLSCYLDDELDARRRGELEAHLVACQRCRGGLANLREEMERVGALARVRIPDHSARFLMESVGLLGPDDELPARSATAVADPPADVPPWLAGEAGPALPWSAARPAMPRPVAPQPPAGPERMSGVPAVPFDVDAITELTAAPPPTVVHVPAAPASWAAAAALAFDPGRGAADAGDEELPPAPAGHQIDIDEAIAAVDGPARDFPAALDAWISAQPGEPEAEPAPGAPPVTELERPEIGLSAALTAPDPPPDPVGHHAITGPIGRRRLFSASGPPRRGGVAPEPVAGVSPSDPSDPTTAAEIPAEPTVPDDVHAATEPGDPAVALTTPPSQVPVPPSYPMTDDDGLDEPIPVERFAGGPIPAPRAGLLSRIRDHLALRRALARPGDDLGDGVEIVSGTGAPARGPRPSRHELARRRSEALRPAGMPAYQPPPAASTGIPPADPVGEVTGRTAAAPRREPSLYQQLPPPARPSTFGSELGARGGAGDAGAPEHDVARLEGVDSGGVTWRAPVADPVPPVAWPSPAEPAAAVPPAPPAPAWQVPSPPEEPPSRWRPRDDAGIAAAIAPPPPAAAPPPAPAHSPSQSRDGRRLLALFGAAAVVMLAVGLASAHSSSPAPAPSASTSGSVSSGAAPAQPPAAGQPAVVQPPAQSQPAAPQGQPATQGEPGAAGGPQLNDMHTIGDGGTGWQVASIVYGDHHTFLRARFDLTPNGASSGKPKVSVGFTDPTTLLVVLYGVTPAGGTGSLPNTKVVTGVTLLQPSPVQGATVYQLKLAHPVTVNPLYTGSNPLLLVVDLTG